MTLIENTCRTYNLAMLLIALVSICVLDFESVIKYIVYTLKISTSFSMKKSLKIPKSNQKPNSKDRQQMAKRRTNTDLSSITQKTKDRATRTLLKRYEGELRFSGKVNRSSSTYGIYHVTRVTILVI